VGNDPATCAVLPVELRPKLVVASGGWAVGDGQWMAIQFAFQKGYPALQRGNLVLLGLYPGLEGAVVLLSCEGAVQKNNGSGVKANDGFDAVFFDQAGSVFD